jgi:hypothetical protein
MVSSAQLEANHCYDPSPRRGRWKGAKGQVHRAWAYEGHAGGLVGLGGHNTNRVPAITGGVIDLRTSRVQRARDGSTSE